MSIFTKLFILFCVSIALMLYLSFKTTSITQSKIQLIYKEKYIQASQEFLNLLVNANKTKLKQKAAALNYLQLDTPPKYSQIIYTTDISFGTIQVVKKSDEYFLHIKYLDDAVWFYDISQKKEQEQKELLNYLIVADILILLIMFFIIIKLLIPLKNISKGIESFGSGDFSLRLPPSKNSDEISKLINTFNAMAQNIQNLITSRTQFLSDISHELRTPISKAKLSLEMLPKNRYKEILQKSISHMDELTNELLQIEKFNSNSIGLDFKLYSIDTLLAEALSKMQIEDEKSLDIQIVELFQINADITYLSIAIKNLLDNALKYKEKGKVLITVKKDLLEIKNYAAPLQKELKFYTEVFTQEKFARNTAGYGLGLNLVKRILAQHNFVLKYQYKEEQIIFSIHFEQGL